MFLAACLPVRRRITDLNCCGGREGETTTQKQTQASSPGAARNWTNSPILFIIFLSGVLVDCNCNTFVDQGSKFLGWVCVFVRWQVYGML
jgi:hypothetical protein